MSLIKYFRLIFILTVVVLILSLNGCTNKDSKRVDSSFSFVFMTDIHLQPEKDAVTGFKKAVDNINVLKPDFVISGGDLIMDALGQKYTRADSLYNLYQETASLLEMPLYNTMGNHEIFGIYKSSDAQISDPEYGEKMFEQRIGKSYYSFDHKGWKFFVINSIEITDNKGYTGLVDSIQFEWIKKELELTDPSTPIVISTHMPFITAFTQKYYGSTIPNGESLVVANSKEVIDLFSDHNLKLVLQGHLHTMEDIYIDGIHFITGGAVSGAWWTGPNQGYEEGFILVKSEGSQFTWEYVDYGWTPAIETE